MAVGVGERWGRGGNRRRSVAKWGRLVPRRVQLGASRARLSGVRSLCSAAGLFYKNFVRAFWVKVTAGHFVVFSQALPSRGGGGEKKPPVGFTAKTGRAFRMDKELFPQAKLLYLIFTCLSSFIFRAAKKIFLLLDCMLHYSVIFIS